MTVDVSNKVEGVSVKTGVLIEVANTGGSVSILVEIVIVCSGVSILLSVMMVLHINSVDVT